MELHSSHNSLEFYPQSIELYLEKFSNWSHLILIRAQTCGKHTINCYIDKGNKTLANAKVDIIKNKFYEQFSRKLLLFYYIFGLMSVYPQLLNNFLYRRYVICFHVFEKFKNSLLKRCFISVLML